MSISGKPYPRPPRTWVIVVLFLVLQLFATAASSDASPQSTLPANPPATGNQAPLSWEQSLDRELPGPGAFLDSVLSRLSRKSDDSEDRLKQLRAGIPDMLPDLYKVFIAL